ncbi:MAG: hypothetical protein JSR17_03370 [Proteobacteria bacterium]|nr:hypothetical protein [Pseudomonadota bacterium]
MARTQVAQAPVTPGYGLHGTKNATSKAQDDLDKYAAKIGISNKDAQERKDLEEKEADKKRIKAAKKIIKGRIEQRRAVFSYKKHNEQNEQSLIAKLGRLNDLNPEALVGEYIAAFIFNLMAVFCQRQFFVQQRAFFEATQLDEQKMLRIATGQATDDGVRVAYQPLRNLDGSVQVDANGDPVYPEVYPVDEAGNIDFHQQPNTDGTAARAAIRANGFVPVEDFYEAFEIGVMKFKVEFIGSVGLTAAQKMMLNQFVDQNMEEGQKRAERDIYGDNAVVQQAAQQQAAARAALAMKPAGK